MRELTYPPGATPLTPEELKGLAKGDVQINEMAGQFG